MAVKENRKKLKPIHYTTDQAISLIFPFLEKNPGVLAAYLFGSRIRKSDPSSDIDIAICTSRDFSWEDYYVLYGKMSQALGSDRVDLVWLNEADPILGFEVLKNGKVLFYKDPDLLNDFELKFKKRYYDYVLYLNKHRRNRGIGL